MRVSFVERVYVVDRRYLYAAALRQLLKDSGSVDESAQFQSLEQLRADLPPKLGRALVIIDENELAPVSEDTLQSLKGICEDCRVICTSDATTREDALSLIVAGADGVILRTQSEKDTLEGIMTVVRGGAYFPAALLPKRQALSGGADAKPQAETAAPAPIPLSTRQSSVYALVAEGKSNKVIARELNLAESTVKVHVRSIYRALRIKSRYQAISYFHQLNQRASSFVVNFGVSMGSVGFFI